jgi:hypothetical protein
VDTLEQLKYCFTEDFSKWLIKSNNHLVNNLLGAYAGTGNQDSERISEFWKEFEKAEKQSLQDILSIILREPEADYFWYVGNNKSRDIYHVKFDLYYHVPTGEHQPVPGEPQTVPGDSLRVDKDKIKVLLRDYKINRILE